jgi:aspartate ammonia-lyase
MKIYYGDETKKAISNFSITKKPVDLRLIKALALVKIATADANLKEKKLDSVRHGAIVKAAWEIIEGRYNNQFVTDSIQGGAGTSINMNVNEVIANRATEILKNKTQVHYLDHVNLSQSTNDVVPTAFRLVLLRLIDEYSDVQKNLEKIFLKKSNEFKKIIKVGRTHLQDAVPITLGQEFRAYGSFVNRDRLRLLECKKYLLVTNLGGTAIGTGINSSKSFIKNANKRLAELSGYDFKAAKDLIDSTQDVDCFLHVAYILQISAIGISKICNDLRLMASGPSAGLSEIHLPELQKGSSIMPGKINPVSLEVINQLSFEVCGHATVASLTALSGQFELNVMMPVMIRNVIGSFTMLINGIDSLARTVDKIQADKENCEKLFENSLCMATSLTKYIGYDKTSSLVKRARKNKITLAEEVKKEKILNEKQFKEIFPLED